MRKSAVILISLLAIYTLVSASPVFASGGSPSDRAAAYLKSQQYSNGTYGAYLEHWAASAAYGLYLYEGNSTNLTTTLSTLKSAMESKSWWFWDPIFGEADIPGFTVYTFASTQHITSLNLTRVLPLLSAFRNTTSGGYRGYYGVPYDSVNTVYALLGLIAAKAIAPTNLTQSFNYLLSLQVKNGPMRGSFNMTSSISNSSFQSLAPDPISQTAEVLMAFNTMNPSISSTNLALNFLRSESVQNSSHTAYNGQVFAAALSAIAFKAYGNLTDAQNARGFLVANQNSDGGFADRSRYGWPSSNALDTAWALISLQEVPIPLSTTLPGGPSFLILLLGTLLLPTVRKSKLVSSSRRQESLPQ